MKKILFFIFLVFLPMVCGVAVTPISLDFGMVERNGSVVRELLIFNNHNRVVDFFVGFDNFSQIFEVIPNSSFSLESSSAELVSVRLTPSSGMVDGSYSATLYVRELFGGEGVSFVNGLGVVVSFVVEGGDLVLEEEELGVGVGEFVNLGDVVVNPKNLTTVVEYGGGFLDGVGFEKVVFLVLVVVVFLLFAVLCSKKKLLCYHFLKVKKPKGL